MSVNEVGGLVPPFLLEVKMMNLLAMQQTPPQPACDCEALRGRVEDLEDKIESMEIVLAGLLPAKKQKWSILSFFRGGNE